jgi:DNA-binding IclR family transcriptional regulator
MKTHERARVLRVVELIRANGPMGSDAIVAALNFQKGALRKDINEWVRLGFLRRVQTAVYALGQLGLLVEGSDSWLVAIKASDGATSLPELVDATELPEDEVRKHLAELVAVGLARPTSIEILPATFTEAML